MLMPGIGRVDETREVLWGIWQQAHRYFRHIYIYPENCIRIDLTRSRMGRVYSLFGTRGKSGGFYPEDERELPTLQEAGR